MPSYTDQCGHEIILNSIPKRIISLVPSQSELLWDLGLKEELVGITKFCIHPEIMYTCVARVGGTKKLDLDKIRSLKPDLIIGNKEENEKEQIEQLKKEFNVWMSDIYTIEDALNMIMECGKICGVAEASKSIVLEILNGMEKVRNTFEGKKCAYLIWKDPYMLAGGYTFINSVMNWCGLMNVARKEDRYPETSLEQLRSSDLEIILLSSEPYPFKEKDVEEIEGITNKKVIRTDGEIWSWYGSRMLRIADYVKELKKKI